MLTGVNWRCAHQLRPPLLGGARRPEGAGALPGRSVGLMKYGESGARVSGEMTSPPIPSDSGGEANRVWANNIDGFYN